MGGWCKICKGGTEMKKERVYGITGTEYAESNTLIFPHLETALEYIKEEISQLDDREEREYTIKVLMMTNQEIEELPEFDG